MAKKRRKRNPVNLDRYGDLFYDLAGEFDTIIVSMVEELFQADIASEKITKRAIKATAKVIVNRWQKMMRGKLPIGATDDISVAAMQFNELVMTAMAEVFEGDAIMSDPSTAAHKKRIKIKDQVAGALMKAWLRAYH